ncbi:hypothetical protein SKAU_G00069420 [Synaphobranchus kaupii]|uniref:Uncharacterized protein n=1 Tax=Synaphobranchus kaupii TaxID=118154 RepID=A0A9Q1G7I5_SYNKA|nr:hypothetical protein SKAU_G00069420 [Synaphobranchus kaupii]
MSRVPLCLSSRSFHCPQAKGPCLSTRRAPVPSQSFFLSVAFGCYPPKNTTHSLLFHTTVSSPTLEAGASCPHEATAMSSSPLNKPRPLPRLQYKIAVVLQAPTVNQQDSSSPVLL